MANKTINIKDKEGNTIYFDKAVQNRTGNTCYIDSNETVVGLYGNITTGNKLGLWLDKNGNLTTNVDGNGVKAMASTDDITNINTALNKKVNISSVCPNAWVDSADGIVALYISDINNMLFSLQVLKSGAIQIVYNGTVIRTI